MMLGSKAIYVTEPRRGIDVTVTLRGGLTAFRDDILRIF